MQIRRDICYDPYASASDGTNDILESSALFGSHHSRQIPPSSEGKKHLFKPSSFIFPTFSGEHKSVSNHPVMPRSSCYTHLTINHFVVSSNHDTTLSSRIIEVDIGFLPPPIPLKKNTQVSFYSIDPCSTSMIFFGKKWGFHLIRFDHTKQTSSAASPGPNSL